MNRRLRRAAGRGPGAAPDGPGVLVRVWRGDAPAAQKRQRQEGQEVVVVDARGAAGAGGVTSSPGATSPVAWPIGGQTP
jgi:hypothetical protein